MYICLNALNADLKLWPRSADDLVSLMYVWLNALNSGFRQCPPIFILCGWWSRYSWWSKQARIVNSCNIYQEWILNVGWFQAIQWYCLLLSVDVKSEGFVSTFDDLVRTVVWLLQSSSYCILLFKDMGAARMVTTHERFLSLVMMDWSSCSSQLFHCFLQPSYVSTVLSWIAAGAFISFRMFWTRCLYKTDD